MSCPHCGSSAQVIHGRCNDCGMPRGEGPPVATGVMTPIPPGAPGTTTPVPPTVPDNDETRFVTPPPGSRARTSRNATPLTIGQDFGSRYHIIRLLGAGGMGAVYQAWDKVLEVAVAVKVVRPDPTLDEEAARPSKSASNASCCSRARSRTRTSSASTISARSTASCTSRCRTSRDRTSPRS